MPATIQETHGKPTSGGSICRKSKQLRPEFECVSLSLLQNVQPTKAPVDGYRDSFPEFRRLGREVNHSPPASTEVKNDWCYIPPPTYLHGVHLVNFNSNAWHYVICYPICSSSCWLYSMKEATLHYFLMLEGIPVLYNAELIRPTTKLRR